MDNIIKSDSGFENEVLVPEQTDKIVSKREMLLNEKMKQILSGSSSPNDGTMDKKKSNGASDNLDKSEKKSKCRKLLTRRNALILALIIVGIIVVTVLTVFLVLAFGTDPDGYIEEGKNVEPTKKQYNEAYQSMIVKNRPVDKVRINAKEPANSKEPHLEITGEGGSDSEETPLKGSTEDRGSKTDQAPPKSSPNNEHTPSPAPPNEKTPANQPTAESTTPTKSGQTAAPEKPAGDLAPRSGEGKPKTNTSTGEGKSSNQPLKPTAAPRKAGTPPAAKPPVAKPAAKGPAPSPQAMPKPSHSSATRAAENAFVDKNGRPLVRKHKYHLVDDDGKCSLNWERIFNPIDNNGYYDHDPRYQIKHRDIYDVGRDRFIFAKTYGSNFKPDKPFEFRKGEIDISASSKNLSRRKMNLLSRMYFSDNKMTQIKKITYQNRLTLIEDTANLEYLTVLEEKLDRMKLVSVVATYNPHKKVDTNDRERRYIQFKFALNRMGSMSNVFVTEDVLNTIHTLVTSRFK